MRRSFAPVLLLSAVLVTPVIVSAQSAKPATEDEKTLYSLGVLISKNLDVFALTPKELAMVQAGLADGVQNKKLAVDTEQYADAVQAMHSKRLAALTERERAAGTEFLAKAAQEKGATKTASGIVITTVKPGTGASPKETDEVKVHYEGKLVDGKVFDSSIQRGEPVTFPLNGVIPCWTEAVQTMKVGGKSRFVCPSELAYGERGSPPVIRSGATLVFDVELLDIVKPQSGAGAEIPPQAPPAPQAPANPRQ